MVSFLNRATEVKSKFSGRATFVDMIQEGIKNLEQERTLTKTPASEDPDRQFYQSGVPLDQRTFEPEPVGVPDPTITTMESADKKVDIPQAPEVTTQEIQQPEVTESIETRVTSEERSALSDLGSDVNRTNLQKITDQTGNYSQTSLINALEKGIRNENKRALLKGAIQVEVGDTGPTTEAPYSIENLANFIGEWRTRSINAGLLDSQGNVTQLARDLNAQGNLGETIFNVQYAGRNGNGDIASGDGNTFRGRGLIQITGRGTYQEVDNILKSNGINIDLVNNPDLANDTRYALPVAMAYLESVGLTDQTAPNSSAKDLNNKVNAGANARIAEERWSNVVQALRDSGKEDEANRMENRNEYSAQRTAGLTGNDVDGAIGEQSRTAITNWLTQRNINIPENATDMDLVVLVNTNAGD